MKNEKIDGYTFDLALLKKRSEGGRLEAYRLFGGEKKYAAAVKLAKKNGFLPEKQTKKSTKTTKKTKK